MLLIHPDNSCQIDSAKRKNNTANKANLNGDILLNGYHENICRQYIEA